MLADRHFSRRQKHPYIGRIFSREALSSRSGENLRQVGSLCLFASGLLQSPRGLSRKNRRGSRAGVRIGGVPFPVSDAGTEDFYIESFLIEQCRGNVNDEVVLRLLKQCSRIWILNLHTGISPYVKGGPNCTNCGALPRTGFI